MELYEKNLQLLKECLLHDDIYEMLNNTDDFDKSIIERNGILYNKQKDSYVQLESRNGEKEAELLFGEIDFEKENLIFILGIGNRTLLRKISELKNTTSKFVIYEPDIRILKYIMCTIDLKDILIPGKTVIWWDYSKENSIEYGEDITALNWGKLVYNIKIIMCPGYAVYSKKFRKVFENAKRKIYQQYMALGNSLEDVLQGFQQNAENFVACTCTNDISELQQDVFKGMPAIIVAAGPSLEKNIHLLKDANNKAVIFSCDASYNACKEHGVVPDAVVSIERGVETYQYYYENKTFDKDVVLIGPSLLWPEIYEKYQGKKILVSKNDDGVDGWWNSQFEKLRYVNTGMSCANLACAAAVVAGCNPIILIGQDLAFTGNRKHSKYTHVEQEGENNAESSDGLLVEDIFGNMIPTDKYYNLFRYWFEDLARYNSNVKLIDATEGGAKINGSTIMTLREAIDKYCCNEKGIMLSDLLKDNKVEEEDIINQKNRVIKETNKLIRKLYKIQVKTEKHYDTLDRLYDKINDEMSENELVKVVKEMQKGDQIIAYMLEQRDTITFFQQYIAQTITHVKALGNELTPANVLKNLYIQGNLMGAVKRACRMLIEECEKLKETVEEKCKEYCLKCEV